MPSLAPALEKINRLGGPDRVLSGPYDRYLETVLKTRRANLVACFPCHDPSGATVRNYSGLTPNGTLTTGTPGGGVFLNGRLAINMIAPASWVNFYSALLNTNFNGNLGTLALWFKVNAATAWTDGASKVLTRIRVNADNEITFLISNVANRFGISREGSTVVSNVNVTTSTTAWAMAAATWSLAADQFKAFFNGSQSGATLAGLGAWVGSLHADFCVFGASSSVGANPYAGLMAYYALWNDVLTAREIKRLYRG